MKLYNTRTRKIEEFKPLTDNTVRLYSCGPTVYDHIHIGNLAAFIAADTLRRVLGVAGYQVQHVMNFTDVDDKTIRRSRETSPGLSPEEALQKLTRQYEDIFLSDMAAIGNDVAAINFIRATDSIEGMHQLITDLYKNGFAYIADDGVYFSIEKYRASGKTYGQLLELTTANTSSARIDNDEYDKESVHDFALWKIRKDDEPAWEFELDGHNLLGRPGWHIECSVMSASQLGQPFDIHTGGVDLIFPHHENEIAQSTASQGDLYANFFVHNEHVLVDGKKMSKSLSNFFTLRDIQERGFEPLAFRLMVLQSHYRSQSNFSWESLEAAQNRLEVLTAFADLRYQADDDTACSLGDDYFKGVMENMVAALEDDLNTPEALKILSESMNHIEQYGRGLSPNNEADFGQFLEFLDQVFGLELSTRKDVTSEQKQQLNQRQRARDDKDWAKSDELRDQLKEQGIGVQDTDHGQIWFRL